MKDNVNPKEKWAFNEDVAKCFPDMLKRSIPSYESMRNLVFLLAEIILKRTHTFVILVVVMDRQLSHLSSILA